MSRADRHGQCIYRSLKLVHNQRSGYFMLWQERCRGRDVEEIPMESKPWGHKETKFLARKFHWNRCENA